MQHPITDAAQALKFMLAGKATLTLKSLKSGEHLTYSIQAPKKKQVDGPSHFVKVRTGNDFAYLGFIASGKFIHGRKAELPANSPQSRAFAWAYENLAAKHMPTTCEIWHEGTCGRCARPLTDPDSIARGLGPDCLSKMECF